MHQPPMQMAMNSSAPPNPPGPITTEQIQKLLDENKQLIILILENQNMGKVAECAQYQTLLQRNLMYLAAIADAQPQAQGMHPQTPAQPVAQQGHFLPHPQQVMTQQQANMFAQKMPLQINNQMPIVHPQVLQQQQFFPGHMGIRPGMQIPTHQMTQGGQPASGNFTDAQGSKHSNSGAFVNDIQGKQVSGDKES